MARVARMLGEVGSASFAMHDGVLPFVKGLRPVRSRDVLDDVPGLAQQVDGLFQREDGFLLRLPVIGSAVETDA